MSEELESKRDRRVKRNNLCKPFASCGTFPPVAIETVGDFRIDSSVDCNLSK